MRISNEERTDRVNRFDFVPKDIIKKADTFMEDVHHYIPISMRGHDLNHNKGEVWQPLHRYIHQTLDVKYALYSELTRHFKKKYNHKILNTVGEIDSVANIQRSYFNNLYTLPEIVVDMHKDKIFETLKYWEDVASNFVEIETTDNQDESFHKLHHKTIEIQKDIARELQANIKKFYFDK